MILWILGILAAVWVIYDVMTHGKRMKDTEKVVWIVCAILFSIITAIVYYIVKKAK